jgi:cytochrome P450
MRRLLMPFITQRGQTAAAGKEQGTDDLLQLFTDGSSQAEKNDPKFLALSLINACLAAIHSTAIVATNAILDLATRPQLMDPLRQGLRKALQSGR